MIELGSKVRDLVTGVTGVASARTEWLYGCARIAVDSTELKKDNKLFDTMWLDEQRVEEVEKRFFPTNPALDSGFKLGSKVKDRITGFEGLAVARTTWASGNVTIGIEPTTLHEGKPIETHSFEQQRVELIEEKAPPVSKQNSAVSGGPQNDPSPRNI
jgi:hypothetical protein